jgi:hypothetical protein
MKTLRVTFEDEEYDALLKAKGKEPWRSWLLEIAEITPEKGKKAKKNG